MLGGMLGGIGRWIVLAAAVALGCAAHAPKPDWVDSAGGSGHAPDARYLFGFGTARGEEAHASARQRAAADLAGQLEVRIEHELRDVSEDRDGRHSYHVAALTRSTVDIKLRGIEYEAWEGEGSVYALARLDRHASARQRRARRDLAMAGLRDCLATASRQESEKQTRQAIATYEECRGPIAEALEHAAVARALDGVGADERAIHVELVAATRIVSEKVAEILSRPATSVSAAAESLALQLERQGISTRSTLVVAPFTYGAVELSSAFGRQMALDLESAIARGAHAAGDDEERKIVLHGVYVDGGKFVRLEVTAKDAETARLVASAGTSLPHSAISPGLVLRPSEFIEALRTENSQAAGASVTGDPRIEMWTSKGRRGVVFNERDEYRLFLRANRPVWVRIVYVLTNGEPVLIDTAFRIDGPLVGGVVEHPERFEVVAPFGVEHFHASAFSKRPPELRTRRQTIDGIDYEVVVDASSEIARQGSDPTREHAPVAESFVAVTTTPRTPRSSH
jgi:hypothetical protein